MPKETPHTVKEQNGMELSVSGKTNGVDNGRQPPRGGGRRRCSSNMVRGIGAIGLKARDNDGGSARTADHGRMRCWSADCLG